MTIFLALYIIVVSGEYTLGMLKRGLYAVGGTWWETSIALAANHLLAVTFRGKGLEGGFDDTTMEARAKD